MIVKIPPNKIRYNKETKLIGPYGSGEFFWNKLELAQFVFELNLGFHLKLPDAFNPFSPTLEEISLATRKQLANVLLCSFETKSTTVEERARDKIEPDQQWFDWVQKKRLQLIAWTPLGQNVFYQSWFARNIKTGFDFAEWMIGVITESLPSPMYDFEDENDDENLNNNLDNSWWHTPAHRFLIEMNESRQFITLDSQTIDELGKWCQINEPPKIYRSYVHGLMLKATSQRFIEEMNARGFFAYWTGTQPIKRLPNSFLDSSLRPKPVDYFANEKIFHPMLRHDIHANYHYVSVIDSVNYRPAEDALFPTIICVLNDTCKEE